MYICRETLTRAILQKFGEKGYQAETIDQLYDKITDKQEANQIINSIKICDPAVGSGHFLVSALNEIIAIKSELKILLDRQGKTLRDYHIEVVNDELMVTDDGGELFSYSPKNKESQRIQEALFHEKQTFIENCLFGVDINPNSVKICRLRLWIELLKNAYYKSETELETLPNIDINIKVGNSLISRFALESDLQVASRKIQSNIQTYQNAVQTYRNAESKQQKREMLRLIQDIKESFRVTLDREDKRKARLRSLEKELFNLENQLLLFEESPKEKKTRERKINQLKNEIDKLNAEIEEIESGKIYQNAFEWRFEFPEVLDNEGKFIGFDVVIGNPPYVFARDSKNKGLDESSKQYFLTHYQVAEYQVNLYPLFLEKAYHLLKSNRLIGYITPNNWLTINTNKRLREFILNNASIKIINFYSKVFVDVDVDSSIIIFEKHNNSDNLELFEYTNQLNSIHKTSTTFFLNQKDYVINIEAFKNQGAIGLLDKIELQSLPLKTIADVKVGLKAYQIGKGKPPQTTEIKESRAFHSKSRLDENYLKYLEGKDVCRYYLGWSGEFLKYGTHLAEARTNFNLFSTPRILVRQIPSPLPYCINACFTQEILLNDLNSMNIINFKQKPELILGVLNSKLTSYWFAHKFGKLQRGIFPQFKVNELEMFPIPKNFQGYENIIIDNVNKILEIKSNNPQADVSKLETEIDEIVYQLYGLNKEEIRMIEEGIKRK